MCVTSIFDFFPQIIRVLHQDEYFLHIGISVLLLFSNCKVATSLFHHEGGVRYQGEYFLHNGTSVFLLFSNCIVVRFCFTIITKISIFLNIVILLIITRLMIK